MEIHRIEIGLPNDNGRGWVPPELESSFLRKVGPTASGNRFEHDVRTCVAQVGTVQALWQRATSIIYTRYQLDVKSALLPYDGEEGIHTTEHVAQTEGFEKNGKKLEDLVFRLHKYFYGARQSPRNWNGSIDKWLISHEFGPGTAHIVLYITTDGLTIALVYVDGIMLSG